MRIIYLAANAVQGQTFAHEMPKGITIFTGKNGAGKTTRLKAIELGLRGPGKQDARIGEKSSVHLRLQVPASVHPGARLEVLRGLTPKHSLALQPLAAAGSKSVNQAQGQLDSVIQLVPATFDVRAFTALSADKQKAALMPYATYVPATQYLGLYEAVGSFEGESGSDYLARVRVAISQEINALQQKKLAAEKASLELANKDVRQQRSAAQVRVDLGILDRRLELLRASLQARRNRDEAALRLNYAKQVAAGLEERAPQNLPPAPPYDSTVVRAELSDAQHRLDTWMQHANAHVAVQNAEAALQQAQANMQSADAALAQMGGGPAAEDPGVLQAQIAALQALLANDEILKRESDRLQAELGAATPAQLLPRAVLACIEASALQGNTGAIPELVCDLRDLLTINGYPSTGRLQQQLKSIAHQRTEKGVPFHAEAELAELQQRLQVAMQASAAGAARGHAASMAEQARQQAQRAADVVAQAQQSLGTWGVYDQAQHHAAHQRVMDMSAKLQAVLQVEQQRAAVSQQLAELDRARSDAAGAIAAHEAEYQRAAAIVPIADKALFEGAAAPIDFDALTADVAQTEAKRPSLQAELDEAIRAEGRLQAEQSAFADAEQAKTRIEELKALDKRVKDAADECLRAAMGKVAEAFQPFAELIGATWKLGTENPLGIERDGQWIDFENLSDSEQLVFGIGLVLALSTMGNGLRIVLLDNLDACDLDRRAGLVKAATRLLNEGKLDQICGTAWSPDGFAGDSVQVIEVLKPETF